MARGVRSEERGRDARAMGHMCDPRRISSLYGIACSCRGTHDGSSATYVRFICFVVHAVQKIVCAEPMATAISTTSLGGSRCTDVKERCNVFDDYVNFFDVWATSMDVKYF